MSQKVDYMLLPSFHQQKNFNGQNIITIPFRTLAWLTVSLPLFGFLFCIIWSIVFNFEHSTSTHCDVFNFLPSVSAAIGNYAPQKHVWRVVIFLHAPSRFVVIYVYYKYYHNILFTWAHIIGNITCFLNFIENIALIGLTHWSSSENYFIHANCFITFVAMSELNMLLMCILLQRYRKLPPDNIETRSLKLKWKLFFFNICFFSAAAYFFMRHNSHCEPLVYSFFALAEYLMILSNMSFHMTSYLDFHEKVIFIHKNTFQVELS